MGDSRPTLKTNNSFPELNQNRAAVTKHTVQRPSSKATRKPKAAGSKAENKMKFKKSFGNDKL